MVVGYARCIYATIKGVGMSIWTLFNRMWLMVDRNAGVDACRPLKGYERANIALKLNSSEGRNLIPDWVCTESEYVSSLKDLRYCTILLSDDISHGPETRH